VTQRVGEFDATDARQDGGKIAWLRVWICRRAGSPLKKMHGGNEVQPGDVDALLYYYGDQAANDFDR